MVIDDLNKVEQLERACGNRYLAIQFITKATRKLARKYSKYHILESKLIEWVISGQRPYTQVQLNCRIRSRHNELEEVLCWVNDNEVADEVRKLYSQSLHRRRLKMCTSDVLDPGKVDRVNVLLRMIWYSENI